MTTLLICQLLLSTLVQTLKPVSFSWFEEHYGAIKEGFRLFSGHVVIEAAEELFCSVF